MNGPICPIYGCGVLLMLILLIPVRDGVDNLFLALPVAFLAGAALASAVEYFTSWAMEKLFHARWWDYSQHRFNLNGRICLHISLAWGGLATVFIYWVQPLFERLVARLYGMAGWLPTLLAGGLGALFLVDLAVSVHVARAIGNKLEQLDKWAELIREHLESVELPSRDAVIGKLEEAYAKYALHSERRAAERKERMAEWHVLPEEDLRRRLADAIDELKQKRTAAIEGTRSLQRRMLRAFPHMDRRGKTSATRDLRAYWKAHREKKRKKAKSAPPQNEK